MAEPAQVLEAARRDPDGWMLALDKARAEKSLLNFTRLMWPVLEPMATYKHGWVVERICEHLEAVTSGQVKRLLINVPPGSMKSMLVNVLWPAWEWGPRNLPGMRYCSFAYADTLTLRDNRRCRSLILSEFYQRLWGDRFSLDPTQHAKGRFDNNHMGFRFASSVHGVATGERGHRVILDDPHNVKTVESDTIRESTLQFVAESVPTRLCDPPNDAIVCIMQRTHSRDVSGLILARELNYEWLCMPMEAECENRSYTSVPRNGIAPIRARRVRVGGEAIPRWLPESEPVPVGAEAGPVRTVWPQDDRQQEGELLWPERFPRDYLENTLKPEMQSWGGNYACAGQLQQRPAPRGGGIFKRQDFRVVDRVPDGPGETVRGWDLAASDEDSRAAWTVGVKLKRCGTALVVLDVVRLQGDPNAVEAAIVQAAARDGRHVHISIPQDPGQAGKAQVRQYAGKLAGYLTHSSPESGSKIVRARPVAAEAENGNLFLLRSTWNDAFIAEATQFPVGDHSDQVDAMSRAYARLLEVRPRVVAGSPILFEGGRPHGSP